MNQTTKDAVPSTPGAQWRVDGQPDPHAGHYDGERAALTLGKLTDDELANGVFMNGDQPMNIERMLAHDPDYHAPIIWLTAAKERIRWLSRALERALAAPVAPTPAEQAEAVTISELCARQYDWVERMGWHNKTVLEALALIASEVGEAVNECRGEAPTEAFGEELADVLLRTFDLAQWQGIDLEAAILRKMAINEQRGTRGRRI